MNAATISDLTPVFGANGRDILDRIVAALKFRLPVTEVWLFGSCARATAAPGSDLDLLVVLRDDHGFDRPTLESFRIVNHIPNAVPADVVAITESQWQLEKKDHLVFSARCCNKEFEFMGNDVRDPEAWYDFAQKDLNRARKRLADSDYEDCIFHMQQCAEKVMKGKLIALGWDLQKTHNLAGLAAEIAQKGIDLGWFDQSADLLTTQYLAERYPGFSEPLPELALLTATLEDTQRLFESLSARKTQ